MQKTGLPLAYKLRRAAAACDISTDTMRKLIDEGVVESVKIGARLHVPRHEIMRLCGARKGE